MPIHLSLKSEASNDQEINENRRTDLFPPLLPPPLLFFFLCLRMCSSKAISILTPFPILYRFLFNYNYHFWLILTSYRPIIFSHLQIFLQPISTLPNYLPQSAHSSSPASIRPISPRILNRKFSKQKRRFF